jgi:hypothetical protein
VVESGSKKVREGHAPASKVHAPPSGTRMEDRMRTTGGGTFGGDVGEARRGTGVAEMSRSGYERTKSMKAVQTKDERDNELLEDRDEAEDGGSVLEKIGEGNAICCEF